MCLQTHATPPRDLPATVVAWYFRGFPASVSQNTDVVNIRYAMLNAAYRMGVNPFSWVHKPLACTPDGRHLVPGTLTTTRVTPAPAAMKLSTSNMLYSHP